ncbi:MAG: chalcone isomerase family protein [Alcanivorax sp.]|nr:chalcone isomerase family protein [Alcanivorax sp.]
MVTRSLITAVLILAFQPALAWKQCHQADVKALHFFTVGKATLLRKDCQADNLLAPPLRLQFQYFHDVPGDAFAKAARHFLEKNLDSKRFQQLEPRIVRFDNHYQDIGDGDRYTLTYLSDGSLALALNGQPLAREQGDDFASAYLSIWFGQHPYSQDMKDALLGR